MNTLIFVAAVMFYFYVLPKIVMGPWSPLNHLWNGLLIKANNPEYSEPKKFILEILYSLPFYVLFGAGAYFFLSFLADFLGLKS